jgi:hypothetical protein
MPAPSQEHVLLNAANVGPKENFVSVTLAPAASTAIDLNAIITEPGSGTKFVTVFCEALTYYKFAVTNANIVDETATAGATRCFAMPAGTERMLVPAGCRYLVVKSAGASVRVHQSTEFRG